MDQSHNQCSGENSATHILLSWTCQNAMAEKEQEVRVPWEGVLPGLSDECGLPFTIAWTVHKRGSLESPESKTSHQGPRSPNCTQRCMSEPCGLASMQCKVSEANTQQRTRFNNSLHCNQGILDQRGQPRWMHMQGPDSTMEGTLQPKLMPIKHSDKCHCLPHRVMGLNEPEEMSELPQINE